MTRWFAWISVWAIPCAGFSQEPASDPLAPLVRELPKTTCTKRGTQGDPVNVVLVGSRGELCTAMRGIGWHPTDPVNLRSAVGITFSSVFNVRYPGAPVSLLYMFDRQQDVAFESAVTRGARTRHHVRFWCAGESPTGRAVWVGADTFDAKIGISKATGKPTHHIDPDIDRERDFLIQSLRQCAFLERDFAVPHLPWRVGRNGENDCYFTDGNIAIGVLKECRK